MSAAVTVGEAYAAYLAAIRVGDRRLAFGAIDAAHGAGIQIGTIYLEVFQPALREVGRLWQVNELSVAEEHLATAITQSAMARLYERVFAWSADDGPTVVAACVDAERHEIGLRMLCDLLDVRGWQTHYLGASVPVDSLIAMVLDRRPAVVALSASIAPHLPRLGAMVAALRDATGAAAPLILVGGRPFLDDPALAWQLGADLTARDAVEAVEQLCARISCT